MGDFRWLFVHFRFKSSAVISVFKIQLEPLIGRCQLVRNSGVAPFSPWRRSPLSLTFVFVKCVCSTLEVVRAAQEVVFRPLVVL